ncbi:TPA: hypothetical protein SMP50_000515 [Proteus mirabilis]|nr:hypothetical protein [Proteus mirabilis]
MNKKKAISQYENLMSQYQKLRGNIKVPDEISIDEVKQWLLDVSSFMHNYFPEKKQYNVEMAYQGAGAVSCFSISPPVLSPNQQTVIPETIACWLPCLTA